MSSDTPKDRIQDLLVFSRRIHDEILALDPPSSNLSDETIRLLDKYTTHLPLFKPTPSVTSRRQLDSVGVSLWNACAQSGQLSSNDSLSKHICRAQAFAYGMIEAAGRNNERGTVRIIEMALSAIKECIHCNLLDISQQIVETVALYLNTLEKSETRNDQTKTQSLYIQYYMLRVHLAWCQDRPDIADHLYLQVPSPNSAADQMILMEISYRLGELACSSSRYRLATKWAERALAACEASAKEAPGSNLNSNQKFLILHQLVRASVYCDKENSRESLRQASDVLKSEYGTTCLAHVLQLEVLLREEQPAWQAYVKVLCTAIDSADSKSAHPKLLLRYVQKLRHYNSSAFLEGLKKLLTKSLSPSYDKEWAERAVLTLFWVLSDAKLDCAIDMIQEIFHNLKDSISDHISETAAHACLIVIWKHIDALISAGAHQIAAKWCRFVLEQPLFRIGSDNQAKLLRKMVVCSLSISDSTGVNDMFNQLPEDRKNDPSTLYLMHKLAVCDKSSLKHEYLGRLCESGNEGFVYLVACTSDALGSDNNDLAVRALERTILKYDGCDSQGPVIANLCQQVLCLLVDKLHTRDEPDNILNQILSILEAVAKLEQDNLLSSIGPSWLARNIYLCALKEHKTHKPERVMQLLDFCIKFIEIWQKTACAAGEIPRIHQHYLDIDFLRAFTIISNARKQTALSDQQQTLYTKTLESTQRFRTMIQSIPNPTLSEENSNNTHKHRFILSFDLEASLLLNNWAAAAETIRESTPILDDKLASVFLDCILRSPNTFHANIAQLVKLLLRTLHTSPSICANPPLAWTILPRYLHVLFQLSLDAKDDPLAESVLDETLSLSQRETSIPSWYPADEIQWLATVAFNHAVDLYLLSADEDSRRWAQKAIALADSGGDGGRRLGRLLREKYEMLT